MSESSMKNKEVEEVLMAFEKLVEALPEIFYWYEEIDKVRDALYELDEYITKYGKLM